MLQRARRLSVHAQRFIRQARLPNGAADALQTLLARQRDGGDRAHDTGDAPVAQIEKMLRHQLAAAQAVQADGVQRDVVRLFADQDDGQRAGNLYDPFDPVGRKQIDNAVHLLFHAQVQIGVLPFAVAVRAAQKHVVAAPCGIALDVFHQHRVKGVIHRGKKYAQQLRLARFEALGKGIGDVLQLLCGLQHFAPRLVGQGDAGRIVDDKGHRGLRNAGQPCDIFGGSSFHGVRLPSLCSNEFY